MLVFGSGKLLFHELSFSSAEKTQSAFTQLRRLRDTLADSFNEIAKASTMRNSTTVFFILCTNILLSQSNEYKSAIGIIKASLEFAEYSNTLSPKNNKVKIVETTFPICAYCSWFKESIECCETKKDIIDMFPEQTTTDLSTLSDKGNRKFSIHFTNIEKSFFVAEVMYSKDSKENLLYLFKTENNKVTIAGLSKNVVK